VAKECVKFRDGLSRDTSLMSFSTIQPETPDWVWPLDNRPKRLHVFAPLVIRELKLRLDLSVAKNVETSGLSCNLFEAFVLSLGENPSQGFFHLSGEVPADCAKRSSWVCLLNAGQV
jgi:hypothetical protein